MFGGPSATLSSSGNLSFAVQNAAGGGDNDENNNNEKEDEDKSAETRHTN